VGRHARGLGGRPSNLLLPRDLRIEPFGRCCGGSPAWKRRVPSAAAFRAARWDPASRSSCCRPSRSAARPRSSATARRNRAPTTSRRTRRASRHRTAGRPRSRSRSTRRHATSGAAATSVPGCIGDISYQGPLTAALILLDYARRFGAAVLDDAYRCNRAGNQSSSTIGRPHVVDLVSRLANHALKAAWYQLGGGWFRALVFVLYEGLDWANSGLHVNANTSTLSVMSGQVSSTLNALSDAIDELELPVDGAVVGRSVRVGGSTQRQAAGLGW
jgi:hypothetical protein